MYLSTYMHASCISLNLFRTASRGIAPHSSPPSASLQESPLASPCIEMVLELGLIGRQYGLAGLVAVNVHCFRSCVSVLSCFLLACDCETVMPRHPLLT